MKKADLKKMLKPIIQECIDECIEESIHEALFGSGIVTSVVAEVIKGVNIPQLVESVVPRQVVRSVPAPVELYEDRKAPNMTQVVSGKSRDLEAELQSRRAEHNSELESQRKRLEESLGGMMGGANVFEGLTPSLPDSDGQGPLSGVDPTNPGVDITSIPGLRTLNFKRHIEE